MPSMRENGKVTRIKPLKDAIKQSGAVLIAANIGVSVATLYNWTSKRTEPRRRDLQKLEELGLTL